MAGLFVLTCRLHGTDEPWSEVDAPRSREDKRVKAAMLMLRGQPVGTEVITGFLGDGETAYEFRYEHAAV